MQSINLTLGATSTGAREEQVNIAYYRGVYKVACSQIEAMAQVLQMLVVERKSQKKYHGLYASICSQTRWCACSPLPSYQVRVAHQGRNIRLKCLAEDDLRKNRSHNACEFHSGPRPNRAYQKEDCNWHILADESGRRSEKKGRGKKGRKDTTVLTRE